MAKQKVSTVNKKQEEKDRADAIAFADDLKAVEKKHGMRIIPLIEYTSQGLYPTLGRQRVDEVELKADKKEVTE